MAFPLDVVVACAVRTPVGRSLKGTLRSTRPDDLAAAVMVAAVERVKGLEPGALDDVVLGCAMPEAEQGLNIARNALFLARFPNSVPAETINRFCSSGLQSIAHGAMAIQSGLSEVVLAGGVESMSMVPMSGNKVSLNPKLMETYPEAYIAMGHTAERALAALAASRFDAEVIPVQARLFEDGATREVPFSVDELPRAGTTLDVLAKLKPAFKQGGSVTAGNSSPLSDGAAATILMSQKRAAALGVRGLGRFRAYAVAGVDPDIMGIGPVPAIRRLLSLTGLQISDIDLFEINEAFAAQAVYCQRELGIPDEKLNVNGGAIALGHPLGCTGTKLSATLLHELQRRGGRYGIVSMCIGGGMGAAGLFEVERQA
jgi:acetyl-CoA acyltransferase